MRLQSPTTEIAGKDAAEFSSSFGVETRYVGKRIKAPIRATKLKTTGNSGLPSWARQKSTIAAITKDIVRAVTAARRRGKKSILCLSASCHFGIADIQRVVDKTLDAGALAFILLSPLG